MSAASETWEQMEARHARERAEMVARIGERAKMLASPQIRTGRLSIAEIAETVALQSEISVSDIRGPSRMHRFVRPRQRAYCIASKAGYSKQQIGNYFGGRDHTTVISGIRSHKKREGL